MASTSQLISRRGSWIVGIFSFLIYANTIGHGFVLDDKTAITENRLVKKGISSIGEIWSHAYMFGYSGSNQESYRPTSTTLFAIETSLFGDKSSPYHLVHVMLYALLVMVLFKWLSLLFNDLDKKWVLLAALVFAALPVHTEVVANLKSADELLCLLFGLSSFLYFTRYLHSHKRKNLLAAGLFLMLATLSKETAVTYIVIYPVIAWLRTDSKKSDLISSIYLVIPIAVYFVLRFSVLEDITFEEGSFKLSTQNNALLGATGLSEFLGTSLKILGYYLLILFIPFQLSYDYSLQQFAFEGLFSLTPLAALMSYLALVGITIWGVIKKRKWALATLVFIATLSISSNLVVQIAATAAERFLFSPSLLLPLGILGLISERPKLDKSVILTGIISTLILIYGIQTINRNFDWQSNETLFLTDVETCPESFRTQHFAASVYKKRVLEGTTRTAAADLSKAAKHLTASMNIFPEFQDNYVQLTEVYKLQGNYSEGEKLAIKALKEDRQNVDLLMHLGDIYLQSRQYSKGQKVYEDLRERIDSSRSYVVFFNLAACYYNDRKFEKAIPNFQQALIADPSNQDGHHFIGVSYYELQEYEKAIKELIQVTEGNGNYPWSQFSIGTSYMMLEKWEEAIPYLEKSLSYTPNDTGAISALAKAYESAGDTSQSQKMLDRLKELR